MAEIGIIVNSSDLFSLAQGAAADSKGTVEAVLTHTYDESLNRARKMAESGVMILISRGGHSTWLREHGINIPIIDIPFTGNNIAALMVRAKKEYGRFGVIGNEPLIRIAKDLEEAIGNEMVCFEVKKWKDFETQTLLAKGMGIKAIVGGYDASRFTEAEGLASFCVTSNSFEITTALLEAKKILSILKQEKQWNEMFRTVIDSIREGIVILDEHGIAKHVNRQAKKLLAADGLVTGMPVQTRGLQEKIHTTLKYGTQFCDELFEASNYKYTSSIFPITVEKKIVGAVAVLQEVEYVRKIEQKIRYQRAQRGLIARKTFADILSNSELLLACIQRAKQYSIVDSTVLISGESGTGKEQFAQSIHNFSLRREEAFVAINCAAISPHMLETELFGYVEGAFEGAKEGGKIGLFELAHNGTIFLDEISEIKPELQAQMLRVLEEKQIMRIGDDQMIPINIRIIAATNKDLKKMVAEKGFREDFFYRLNVLSLQLPPLRDRREDLELLTKAFINQLCQKHNRNMIQISEMGMCVLMNYEWPGNIRELKNVIERLVVTGQSTEIGYNEVVEALDILPKKQQQFVFDMKPCINSSHLKEKNEHELIRRVLMETEGNKTEAARRLGISRPTLHRKLKDMETVMR